jgi:hypothetical protein
MALVAKPKVKQKKHGKKTFVRVSNKKAVKNGRQQPAPKVKKLVKKKPVGKIAPAIPEVFSELDELDALDAELEREVEDFIAYEEELDAEDELDDTEYEDEPVADGQ